VAIGNVPATPVVDPVQPAEMWIATSPPRGLVEGMSSESMTDFLQSGAVIDCTDPTIVAAAAEIAGDAMDDEEIAKRYFLWVRDSVQHSSDGNNPVVTCAASAVLKHRAGFCYAKSHLLVALLRARGIPAALCYQRLAFDDSGSAFFLHGLVAIHLQRHGWYRVDPRGNKPGVFSDFSPPVECLPYTPTLAGEQDVPGRFAEPLACVISTLERWPTASDVRANLPDYSSESTPPSVSGTR
jgi:transglutaminase-like putative cysteine protease